MRHHDARSPGVPTLCRLLLSAIAPLVPSATRTRWRQEWEAELWHSGEPRWRLFARCIGALPHAISLRAQVWRPEMLFRDLRFALRSLLRRPTFTVVAVLTLALGIGGTTAIFSLVNEVILEPLPYPQPQELVMVWEHHGPRDRQTNVVNPGNFNDWREQNQVFEGMAAFLQTTTNLTGVGEPEEVSIVYSSPELFTVLGIQADHGRLYAAGRDDQESGVVVADHGFWMRHAGGDPGFVGSTLTLNGRSMEVLGVLPPGSDVLAESAELWAPYVIPPERRGRSLRVVARLRDGVSTDQAQAEMTTIAARLEQEHPEFNEHWSANVQSLSQYVVGDVRSALFALFVAVAFLMLIACANVANLMLGRASGRRRELALRTSLGASRGRLMRQLLTESALIGGMGGLAGLVLASAGIGWLVRSVPEDLRVPRLSEVGVDLELFGFAIAAAALTTVLFGLLPALNASGPDLAPALRDGGRGGEERSTGRLRSGLVIAEVSLSLMLLVGAGLMSRSFGELVAVHPGVRAENVVTAHVNLRGGRYPDDASRMAFFRDLQDRMRAVPGVVAVGTSSFLPLTGVGSATSYYPLDRPTPSMGDRPAAVMRFVTGDYFQAMGIPLMEGRPVGDRDAADQPLAVVVDRALAEAHWPGEIALGKRLSVGWGDDPSVEIVGVVGDVLHEGAREGARPTIYVPWQQLSSFPFASIAIRSEGASDGVVRALRDGVRAIDPNLPLTRVRAMTDVAAASVAQPRLTTFLLGGFAVLAMALAAVGIYGVMSFDVSRRVHEMGIRMALGARAADVVGLVVGHGMTLALAGVVLGAMGAVLASRVLATLLFRVSTTDPLTYAAVIAVLVTVAFVACYLPARRATRVDPVRALRQE